MSMPYCAWSNHTDALIYFLSITKHGGHHQTCSSASVAYLLVPVLYIIYFKWENVFQHHTSQHWWWSFLYFVFSFFSWELLKFFLNYSLQQLYIVMVSCVKCGCNHGTGNIWKYCWHINKVSSSSSFPNEHILASCNSELQ